MPVELIAGWLVSQAYKLFVLPIAGNIQQRINNHVADRIVTAASNVFGAHAPGGGEPDVTVERSTDQELVTAIETVPQAVDLRDGLEDALKVDLRADEGRGGTDEWIVSAYAAIYWRIAMLTVWERRPIAIEGALQGREWVTVCVPREPSLVDPSRMWRQPNVDPRFRERVPNDRPRFEFFVRRIKGEDERKETVARLNRQFQTAPTAGFAPAPADSLENRWHRVDGFGRTWVILEPDADAAAAIRGRRPRPFVGEVNLQLHRPQYDEYPGEWRPLLDIESEADGIASLSAGADEFSRASGAAAAAVEAALGG